MMETTPTKAEFKQMLREIPGLIETVGAILPPGDGPIAIVDRARFERVLAAARLAMDWYTNGVTSNSGNVLLPRRSPDVMDRIRDGDLDPLP